MHIKLQGSQFQSLLVYDCSHTVNNSQKIKQKMIRSQLTSRGNSPASLFSYIHQWQEEWDKINHVWKKSWVVVLLSHKPSKCPKKKTDPSWRQGEHFILSPINSLTVSAKQSSFFRTRVPDWHKTHSRNHTQNQILLWVQARMSDQTSAPWCKLTEANWVKKKQWEAMLLVTQWSAKKKKILQSECS